MPSPRLKLPALEKNVLKYRALQMVLVLHEFESLRKDLINSIRKTDSIFPGTTQRLPPGCKKPFEGALRIIIDAGIITEIESKHLEEFAGFRNRIGHEIHRLVADITGRDLVADPSCVHDYWALTKIERYREKISKGMMRGGFVGVVEFSDLIFEQAALTYKEELHRLDKKIQKQIASRLARSETKKQA